MLETILKVAIAAIIVVAASEVAKRSTLAGALLVALPLTSLLAIGFLWHETRDGARIAAFSMDIFWLVLPTLPFFLVLAAALSRGMSMLLSLLIAAAAALVSYAGLAAARSLFGGQPIGS